METVSSGEMSDQMCVVLILLELTLLIYFNFGIEICFYSVMFSHVYQM